jgi:hypothetical protein
MNQPLEALCDILVALGDRPLDNVRPQHLSALIRAAWEYGNLMEDCHNGSLCEQCGCAHETRTTQSSSGSSVNEKIRTLEGLFEDLIYDMRKEK